ncbi:MAG: phosphotransferase [Pseudonocardiales bacterium]
MAQWPDGPEIALPAGDVAEGVVRIGDTVRRPHQPTSAAVATYLNHLESVGFAGAPRYLGRDQRGRDVLSFIDGEVAGDPVEPWAAADAVLPSVGRLVRTLHEASDGWVPDVPLGTHVPGRPAPPFPEGERRLVSQKDVTAQNVVFRGGSAVALIDFDLVGWTTRSVDLANTAMHWAPLADPRDRGPAYEHVDVAERLRLLLEAYGTDSVSGAQLLDAAALRFGATYDSMRWNAAHLGGGWARMWDRGVGDLILRRVAWFAGARAELAAALRG